MPHRRKKGSVIYVAKPKLSFDRSYAGGGAFEFNERLRLTKKGPTKSRWNLDSEIFQDLTFFCYNKKEQVELKEDAWKEGYFQSPMWPCQEIVILADELVIQWASDLIKGARLWTD